MNNLLRVAYTFCLIEFILVTLRADQLLTALTFQITTVLFFVYFLKNKDSAKDFYILSIQVLIMIVNFANLYLTLR